PTDTVLNSAPLPLVFWIVPPLPAVPVPVTMNGPVKLVRTMPFAGPPAAVPTLIDLNVRAPPFPEPVTFTPAPVVVVIVLLASVAVTVPPPADEKASPAAVLNVSVVPKVTEPPVLPLRLMPVAPAAVTLTGEAASNETAPAV